VAVGISVVWSTGCEEVHRRGISSFRSRSMAGAAGTQRAHCGRAVAEGATAELPASGS
jgi:hypothetical protein